MRFQDWKCLAVLPSAFHIDLGRSRLSMGRVALKIRPGHIPAAKGCLSPVAEWVPLQAVVSWLACTYYRIK
jgi:hypothetical protein